MMLASIFFTVLLQQAAGETSLSFLSLSTDHPSIQIEITNKHNNLRRMVIPKARNMLKMTWNAGVVKNAANWAQKCILSHSDPNQLRTRYSGYGENILKSSRPLTWPDVIQVFFDEIKNFSYKYGPTRKNAKVHHYTQLVWASSHQLGCAVSYCPQERFKYFYVCQYWPGGNIRTTINTPYKAGKPCGDCPDHCENGLCTNPCMYEDKIISCAKKLRKMDCATRFMKENCLATCKCPSEIKENNFL